MSRLSTKIIPERALDVLKHYRPAYAAGRRLRFAIGSRLGARAIPGIPGKVHYNDFMLTAPNARSVENYRGGAQQFVNILDRSLGEAGRSWDDIQAALEIGCGYGRIVRELRLKIPADRIYVNDLSEEGATFTANEMGVHKIPLIEQTGPEWNKRFDVIYLVSVYTNIRKSVV